MYTVCTYQLAKVMNLEFLLLIPKFFVFLALIAWLITMAGFIFHLTATIRKQPVVEQPKLESI
jgi:hypothetical protein